VTPAGTSGSVVGIVLAGGLSRRMGGGDKGLRDLAGRPMLAHIIDRLAPQVQRIAINANGDPERFSAFGLPVVPDTVGGFAGPLAGVLAGMRWTIANAPEARWIATAPGDAPLLPLNFVEVLAGAVAANGRGIALAQSNARLHPVAGLWPVVLADDLEAALAAGVHKVLDWAGQHGVVPVPFASVRVGGIEADPFFNANTPEEFATLLDLLARAAT
jgi:molybdenum cofactor guanylyltransferase